MKKRTIHLREILYHFRINRKYKDRLFQYIFKEKKDLLALYNAVNGTRYSNADDLTITTLSDAVYLRMKNDIGFLIGCDLNLYEHQSTWNPNMPLRGLLYFTDMLRGYIERENLNLHSSRRIPLPFPKYIIFYNGDKDAPDHTELLLSDAFPAATDGLKLSNQEVLPALECRAHLLNINYGHNAEIMEKCQRLSDYSYFVSTVKQHLDEGLPVEEAIDRAADECIRAGILADILAVNRAEVKNMLLTTFDEKAYRKMLWKEAQEDAREEIYAEAVQEGRQEGIREGRQEGIQEERRQMIIEFYKQNVSVSVIARAAHLSEAEVKEILEESRLAEK